MALKDENPSRACSAVRVAGTTTVCASRSTAFSIVVASAHRTGSAWGSFAAMS
jgi:hypothetical protein